MIVELKRKEDPIEKVLMASLEDMAQPQLDTEYFIEEEEELAKPIELHPLEVLPRPPIELNPIPLGLKYVFLNDNPKTHVIIREKLSQDKTHRLVTVLERHRSAIGYSIHNLEKISVALCTHCIPTDPDISPSREHQCRLNNDILDVVRKEVLKLLHARIIYPDPHSEWVSPVQVKPNKGGMTVVENEKNELIPQCIITGWWMCIDYQKLNKATKKDHFSLPFINEMLEWLAKHSFFCFLDGC
jgi:hypothetical protein